MAVALDDNTETIVVYIVALLTPAIQVYSFCQIQLGLLLAAKASIKVLPKYLN